MTEKLRPLPDILKKNLKILFVGTSPGVRSSQIGHYFAGRSNVFWRLMYESGLTKDRLVTEDDTKMLDYGYGLTDIVKTPTRSVSDIKSRYTSNSSKRLNRTITSFKPQIVAFIGKTGFKIYAQTDAKLEYGYQYTHNGVRFYLVPSTSGQSYADTKYNEKLECFRDLNRYAKSI
ncbi:MAG: mismatch-specific DNA-glycosylase [Thaumarchaeota archaeon]|nr:mismatch-specific DNA-glycosylase [Nitrososphaerota archaeon]